MSFVEWVPYAVEQEMWGCCMGLIEYFDFNCAEQIIRDHLSYAADESSNFCILDHGFALLDTD